MGRGHSTIALVRDKPVRRSLGTGGSPLSGEFFTAENEHQDEASVYDDPGERV